MHFLLRSTCFVPRQPNEGELLQHPFDLVALRIGPQNITQGRSGGSKIQDSINVLPLRRLASASGVPHTRVSRRACRVGAHLLFTLSPTSPLSLSRLAHLARKPCGHERVSAAQKKTALMRQS